MPQLDWLEGAREALNVDPAYRRLGNADVVIGFKAGKTIRKVTLEAFEVGAVEPIGEDDLRDVELVIDMPARDWTNYLKRRGKGTGPSLLSLDTDREIVSSRSVLDKMKFERYHLSIQALIDKGAELAA